MNVKWIVYTDVGDYADIWAKCREDAILKVYKMTLGRANVYDARRM